MVAADDQFTLTGANGAPIRGDVYLPDAASPPLVVVLHGFKGFKDWGFFPWLGRALADEGLAAACVNFSHCGVADDFNTFERLDLFEADTWSKRLYDVQQVLNAARHGLLTGKAQPNPARLGLLGHSMGGGAALLAAARDARVRSVVTLAGVAHPNRIPEDIARAQLAAMGRVAIANARTKQIMHIGREFFDELWTNPTAFDIKAAARAVDVPWLMIHGADDETVPLSEAHELLDAAGDSEHVKLLTLDGAGHTFGAAHPFAGPKPELERAVSAAAAHFRRTL